MYKLFTVVLVLLTSTPLYAEEKAPFIHIVIAADESLSMQSFSIASPELFKDFFELDRELVTHVGAIEMQTVGFIDFFEVLSHSCIPVKVTYMPWATYAEPPVSANMNSLVERALLAKEVALQQTAADGDTRHDRALEGALKLFDEQALRKVLIFTTNGYALANLTVEDDIESNVDTTMYSEMIPTDVQFYGIAYDDQRVTEYVSKYLAPRDGTVTEVLTLDDLQSALNTVYFREIVRGCLSS